MRSVQGRAATGCTAARKTKDKPRELPLGTNVAGQGRDAGGHLNNRVVREELGKPE
jgi:hypothetical protein